MKTLVIYDSEGKVVFTNTNADVQDGEFNPLVVTVPEGKMLIGVNIETGEPIFSDIPPSEIEELKTKNEELSAATLDLADIVARQDSKLHEQGDALLDLANTLAEVLG